MKARTVLSTSFLSTLFVTALSAAVTRDTLSPATSLDDVLPRAEAVVAAAPPPGKDKVSSDTFEMLRYYYLYASSVYNEECPKPNGHELKTWFRDTRTDTQGFIVIDTENQEIVVSFRGTSGFSDFITDARALKVPFEVKSGPGIQVPRGVRVHAGFMDSWDSVAGNVYSNVNSLVQQYPEYSIVTTGHSLGGALASLAGITLQKWFPNTPVRMYTYGQPRTGNTHYANWVMNTITASSLSRVVHTNDAIPHHPRTFTGYLHHGTEYWLYQDPASANNTVVCPRNEDPACSASASFGLFDIGDKPHRTYFGITNGAAFCQ